MLSVLQESFWERLVGVVALRRPTYETIQHDPEATSQAWWIIVLLGLAQGIAVITTPVFTVVPGMSAEMVRVVNDLAAAFTFATPERQLLALAASVAGVILSWYLSSWLLRAIGNRVAGRDGRRVTGEEMRRLVAWGYSPTLASFLTPIPLIGPLLATLGTLWAFVTGVMAVRAAFGVGIWRAIAIEIAAFLVVLLVVVVILVIAVTIAWPFV
ncbi:MAG: YIP1 family protein [Chloroflexota bacterium]|nr:YIP1 family protein [Chloroflexota bacterium]